MCQSTRNIARGPVKHLAYALMRFLQSPAFKRQVMPPIGDGHMYHLASSGGLHLHLPNRESTCPHKCKVTADTRRGRHERAKYI